MTENSPITTIRADAMLTPSGAVVDAELAFGGDGRIVYAGSLRDARTVTHDLTGHVLMPGLVNGHTHSAMTLLRGVSDDDGFAPWLAAVQAFEQHLTHDDVATGLELAMVEMIETGTTAFADMYHWDEALIDLVRTAGMRVFAALATFTADSVGFPGVAPWTGAEATAETERLATRFSRDPQVRIGYGPHAPYTSPPEFLRDIAARSARLGIPIHTHVAETGAEVQDLLARHGSTPVAHLEALGLLEAEVLAAHCVHLTGPEIAMLARTGTAVSHNPVSNLKLGCGIAPLPDLLRAGVRLTLGTDSVASNNSLDLFEEIKLATILHRGVREDAAAVHAASALDLATRAGAEAIGFPESGALETGRFADVIALDATGAAATPLDFARSPQSLLSHLGYAATGADVRHVFIGGRHVYAGGTHLTLDAPAIRARARKARERLAERAGFGRGSDFGGAGAARSV